MARAQATGSAADFLPDKLSLSALREAAATCRGCHLWEVGTQTVFGEGTRSAEVMFVGEQPGDQEDKAGKPFVGPAGRLFDEALEAAGIDRSTAYVTNAVKHFKWEPRGKRRIHKKPRVSEMKACRPWLDAELRAVRPTVIVCLGATAAQAIFGAQFRLMEQRGQMLPTSLGPKGLATIHPSSVLRARDDESRRLAYEMLIADLAIVAKLL
jgi:DNA polymerase